MLWLNIKTANYRVKTRTLLVAIIYRIQYKVMNSAFRIGALKILQKGETILFQTDLARSRITVPKSIIWNQLPESWILSEVVPAKPIQNMAVQVSDSLLLDPSKSNSINQWVLGHHLYQPVWICLDTQYQEEDQS